MKFIFYLILSVTALYAVYTMIMGEGFVLFHWKGITVLNTLKADDNGATSSITVIPSVTIYADRCIIFYWLNLALLIGDTDDWEPENH